MKQILLFSANWCSACNQIKPLMERASTKVPVKVINIDYEQSVVERYNVGSIPTAVLLEDGKEVRRFVGVQSERQIAEFIK